MKVTILDYGAGNLHSLARALASPGIAVRTESEPYRAIKTDLLVLPGVGAFGAAVSHIGSARDFMRKAIAEGLPCLGICLGMQLLFETSEEARIPAQRGLGIFAGHVRRISAARVPHIGWNTVETEARTEMAAETEMPRVAYFANGYVCVPSDQTVVVATTEHEGDRFASIVARPNAVGVQFHPEKSGAPGVNYLRRLTQLLGKGGNALALSPLALAAR